MSPKIDNTELNRLRKTVCEVRSDTIKMLATAQSGHPGGSLSMVEILVALFCKLMKHDPKNPLWNERDRFHLSKGHGCPSLYALFARLGYFSADELPTLRKFGSLLQGHPHPKTPGIEVPSGSLGQGLSVACGMALAEKLHKKDAFVYTIMGDGEMQEGQIWEAANFAAHYKLDNLIAFVDYNGLQIDGRVCNIMNIEPLAQKWESFGFLVKEIDGHDLREIIEAVEELKPISGKPKVLLAKTIKGKGVSFMENNIDFHGKAPSSDETDRAIEELKGE
jgi:transketolase